VTLDVEQYQQSLALVNCCMSLFVLCFYIPDKCQEVVILMKIYGTSVTCFASYQGKSREIIDFNPFMLYLSYFT